MKSKEKELFIKHMAVIKKVLFRIWNISGRNIALFSLLSGYKHLMFNVYHLLYLLSI